MADERDAYRGQGDGKDEPFLVEGTELSDEEETDEGMASYVEKITRARGSAGCSMKVPSGSGKMLLKVRVPKKVDGIDRIQTPSKPPKKVKLSRSALRNRSETPTSKSKAPKKSNAANPNYVRFRNIPKPTERKECFGVMATVAGQHQTTGKPYMVQISPHVIISSGNETPPGDSPGQPGAV